MRRKLALAAENGPHNESDILLGKRIRPHSVKKSHGKLGTGVFKSFECHLPSCGKIFSDRASLKKHMTVHGDKLF